MDKHSWIAKRAYYLWEKAGRPIDLDLRFWFEAEEDYKSWQVCVLNPDSCPFQQVQPTSGGKHVTFCMHETRECGHRALDHNKS